MKTTTVSHVAKTNSFVAPAGRRLSRMAATDLRSSFKDNNLGRMDSNLQAIMRNLDRKDDKIKYNRRLRLALAGGIAVLVIVVGCMLGVTMAANEATKESHVSTSNTMVGLDGQAVTTAKDTSYVKLAEVSRASLEYLSNLEDVTLAAQGKVYQYQISGFVLHDTDNVDLQTMGDTTIEIRCGAIHIKDADGKVINADEMSPEASGAARQLRAFSAFELQAHYEEHASVATRKLAVSNPLKALSSFFGGTAKSSANSELYGALAPTTGCKKPAAIISFARPTIPASSKWTVQDAATKEVQTWYMKLGAENELPMMRFEHPIGECTKSVSVGNGPKSSSWTEFDEALCTDKFDMSTCNATEMAEFGNMTCAEAAIYSDDHLKTANRGEQSGCTHETDSVTDDTSADLKVQILDVKTDGSAVWEIGIWDMEVSATGVPTGIRSSGDESDVFNQVLSVAALDASSTNVFDACIAGVDSVGDARRVNETRRLHETKHKRMLVNYFHAVSGTRYCGGGTNWYKQECPLGRTDTACRLHDYGWKSKKVGVAYRLECAIDQKLWLGINPLTLAGQLVNALFAPVAVLGGSMLWGCSDRGSVLQSSWIKGTLKCGWRGCRGRIGWWKFKRVSKEVTRYGALRYVGSIRYGWTHSQPNRLIWGYRKLGACGREKCRERLCKDTRSHKWGSQRPSFAETRMNNFWPEQSCPEAQKYADVGTGGKTFDPTVAGRSCNDFYNCKNGIKTGWGGAC